MFLRRKIGTGAAARQRRSCECKVGVEILDERVVPSTLIATPGSPIVESGLNATLNVSADEFGHGSASLTTTNPFTGLPTTKAAPLLSNVVNGVLTPIAGVTGTGTPNPLTVAYLLPATVMPGDNVALNFQTGQISEVLRYVNAFNPTTGTFNGYLLVYSDNVDGVDSPADTNGIPAINFTLGTTFSTEFGVEGFDFVDYQAEQATYSILSDANLVSTGTTR